MAATTQPSASWAGPRCRCASGIDAPASIVKRQQSARSGITRIYRAG